MNLRKIWIIISGITGYLNKLGYVNFVFFRTVCMEPNSGGARVLDLGGGQKYISRAPNFSCRTHLRAVEPTFTQQMSNASTK